MRTAADNIEAITRIVVYNLIILKPFRTDHISVCSDKVIKLIASTVKTWVNFESLNK